MRRDGGHGLAMRAAAQSREIIRRRVPCTFALPLPPARAHPPRADVHRLPLHLRALVPLGGALHPRLPRQDLRGRRWRARRSPRASCSAFAQDLALIQSMGVKLVLVHGFRPQVNEQLRAKGHAARYSPRHAHHRRGGARLRPGGRRPAALRDRGRLLAGPAQHADGQRHGARDLGQLPHRAAGGHRRRRRFPAQRAWCARSTRPASARAIDIGALVLLSPVRLLAHRRGLQPDHGRRGHQRGHRAAGRQAAVPDRGARHPRATRSDAETARSTPSWRWPTPSACWPRCPRRRSPPTPAFYLQHCVQGLRGRRRALAHPARSRSTARCCWRSTRTTASAPWWSTRSWRACARPRPTTSAASCS